MRENLEAFPLANRPRVLRDISKRDLGTTLLSI